MSLADQIAALSKRITDLRGIVPSYEWATVASVSPPTVVLDSDATNTPRPVADVLVAGLAVADRVEVRAIGSRRDVIARAGGAPAAAIAQGTVAFTSVAPGSSASASVTFPAGRFSNPPAVMLSVDTHWSIPNRVGVTASGCTVRVVNGASTTTSSPVVQWLAIEV